MKQRSKGLARSRGKIKRIIGRQGDRQSSNRPSQQTRSNDCSKKKAKSYGEARSEEKLDQIK